MNHIKEISKTEMLLQEATKHLGLSEISGSEHNHVIMSWFKDQGHNWVKDDETGWCTCFINQMCKNVGLPYSKALNARSYLEIGKETNDPNIGDIVVFWRESKESWKGHVGIFMGFSKDGNIFCLGGNQGNEVNISLYSKEKLLGFRIL